MNIREILNAIRPYVLGWTSDAEDYTPSWTAPTTNPTLGNGSLVGRYVKRGNMCLISILLMFGSTTNGGSGNWSFSLPFPGKNNNGMSYFGIAHARDAGVNSYDRVAQIVPVTDPNNISIFNQMDNGTNVTNFAAAAPFTFASGDNVSIQIEYEIA